VYTDKPSRGHAHPSAWVDSPLPLSPPVAPDSPVAPPPWSPLPSTPSWHALPPPCFWSSQVSPSPPALACPALPSLRRGAIVRRSSLLLVSRGSLAGLWPLAVRYAAHQLNLWPRVSLLETSPTLRWMGKVGDALVFWVLGSRAFVRNTYVDKLSSRTIPCVFLGFPPDAPGRQFYHPTSHRVLPSQVVTFDESVPFCRLIPYRTAPLPPPPLFLARGPPPFALLDSPLLCHAPPHHFDGRSAQSPFRFLLRPLSRPPLEQVYS
ncbi:unnamed protein product, partial [Closterium sp. NIES-53]